MLNVLQAKIEARERALSNLEPKRCQLEFSQGVLCNQMSAHEIEIEECDGSTPGKQRWLKWAERRLVGMQMQQREVEEQIDTLSLTIARIQGETETLNREIGIITDAKQKEIDRTIKATVTAIFGPKIKKGKNRRYVARGERPKTPATSKSKKGSKPKQAAKGQQQKKGRKAA